MKLVLAEKPSVAQSIAKVLGATKREDGYLEGHGYIVSWCVGHLVELSQPEAYDEKYSKWTYADLPIFPELWKYQVSASTKKQFGILKKLMARKDVESLVCATDAGREGELIFRLVYHQCGCKKPFERLWISSMEDSAIREGFEQLKPSTEYDALYAMYSRLAGNPDDYFEHEDFVNVFEFNTRQTVNALGTAVNAVSSRMFAELEKAIEAYEKTKTIERSHDYERNDLQTSRGLSDSGHRTEEQQREAPGQVRQDAESVSGREQPDAAERLDSQRGAVPAPAGDRRNSTPQSRAADERVAGEESSTGQSDTTDGVGTAHEQPESTGRGNRDSGTYQQLSLNLFLSEAEQINFIDEAESKTPSAFSFAQNEIDQVLVAGGNESNLRMTVALEYMKGKSTEEIAKRLPELYRGGNGFKLDGVEVSVWFDDQCIHLARGKTARFAPSRQVVSWQEAAKRKLLKCFPAEIEKQTGYVHGFEADNKTAESHPQIADGFCGMEILGKHYSEKADAGEMILAACKEMKGTEPIALGNYRGFQMELSFDSFQHEFDIVLKGAVSHRVPLGTDARGNIIRLDNALSGIPEKMENARDRLINLYNQQEATKAELGKPFPQEAELAQKSARLAELDAALNMEDTLLAQEEVEYSEKPSVLADLKSRSEHIVPYRVSAGREEVL